MDNLTMELQQLRETDSDVALILDVYRKIEIIYGKTLIAMGLNNTHLQEVKNSAEVTVSFQPTSSSIGE